MTRLDILCRVFVPAIAAREILIRHQILAKGKMLSFIVICIVLAISATYELIEWAACISAWTRCARVSWYHKDMNGTLNLICFALIGAIAALLFLSKWHNQQRKLISS